uniref:Uncharacterized protein n=1 Tax=Fibrocapsa japonica TaxID=94617 RepID=A0A7S2US73_9STRA|mmetsp:Transcript_10582/g.15778  ORF Transcript_10582/g.15778 Transcript_10582/m.15778 type:complete len:104 (+) Transcript_10582:67-378(+)|eukprot:CAMPEP_0113943740 /NCGR_PEP_ID=MMETSP1339-20121228/27188_1 /TAXON_ID=94617 /ORGANISM="Fibrocapsa japonica" /LENGTH=103 /DNA_ID=CAMNT_0000948685 /DNA_START=51 /DNA_END=362 /DNA_ORIENTATION=- /assembly_acc=CAM_ASM_000762
MPLLVAQKVVGIIAGCGAYYYLAESIRRRNGAVSKTLVGGSTEEKPGSSFFDYSKYLQLSNPVSSYKEDEILKKGREMWNAKIIGAKDAVDDVLVSAFGPKKK